ncbi:hypothetical protein [Paenibacillus pini]
MEKLYTDWLYENGVCSSEFNEDYIKEEFEKECKETGVISFIDV